MTEATRRQWVNKEGGGTACVCVCVGRVENKRREEWKVKRDWRGECLRTTRGGGVVFDRAVIR